MIESVNGVKKVDVFNDIVSRLEDSKKAKVSDDVVSGMKNYYNNKQEYRSRVNLLADNLKGVKPIDSEVNSVIYLSNYMEKGIAIKTSIISFKQIWVEYRLIYNENTYKEENNIPTYNVENNNKNYNNMANNEPTIFSQSNIEIPKFEENKPVDIPTFNVGNTNIGNQINEPINNIETSSFNNNIEIPKYEEPAKFDIGNLNNDFNNFNIEPTTDLNFNIPTFSTNNYEFDNLNNSLEEISIKLDDNYKKLYTKVVEINKYVENFNRKKIELDRQISALEERKNNLSSELRGLENAKKEFSRYKENEEKKISEMKNEVNNKVLSLQNLIDNLDSILGKIN